MASKSPRTSGEQGPSGYGFIDKSDQHGEETDAAIFSYKIPRLAVQPPKPMTITSQKSTDYGSFFPDSPPYVSQGQEPPRPYFAGDKEWKEDIEHSVKSSESLMTASNRSHRKHWWQKVPGWAWVLIVIGTAILLGGIAAIIWAAVTGAWG